MFRMNYRINNLYRITTRQTKKMAMDNLFTKCIAFNEVDSFTFGSFLRKKYVKSSPILKYSFMVNLYTIALLLILYFYMVLL